MLNEIEAILAAVMSKNTALYYGTSRTSEYENIRADGIKPKLIQGDKAASKKRSRMVDSVYLIKNLSYAMVFAFNGNVVGQPLSKAEIDMYKNNKDVRYGYIFTVDSDNLTNSIKPDEDAIGEMYHALVNGKDYVYNSSYTDKILPHDKIPKIIGTIADKYATYNMRLNAKNGNNYGDLSKIGKKIIKYMTPDVRLQLAELTDSVSADSTVIPEHCYRVDKLDRASYNHDGSNFFELAKQMY